MTSIFQTLNDTIPAEHFQWFIEGWVTGIVGIVDDVAKILLLFGFVMILLRAFTKGGNSLAGLFDFNRMLGKK